jgi:hypothetical protein
MGRQARFVRYNMRQAKLCGKLELCEISMGVWASFSAVGMLGKVRHAGSTKVNMLGARL